MKLELDWTETKFIREALAELTETWREKGKDVLVLERLRSRFETTFLNAFGEVNERAWGPVPVGYGPSPANSKPTMTLEFDNREISFLREALQDLELKWSKIAETTLEEEQREEYRGEVSALRPVRCQIEQRLLAESESLAPTTI